MSKTKQNNQEILNRAIQDLPKNSELRGILEQQIQDDFSGRNLERVAKEYPKEMNKFLEGMINKVTKTVIYSRVYANHLKMFKGGELTEGDSLEDIYVHMAEMKNFDEHWEKENGTEEADLIRALKPKISVLYNSINFDKKSKTTVFRKQMIKAFYRQEGLQDLITQVINSIKTRLEYEEEQRTIDTICRLIDGVDYNGKILVGTGKVTDKKFPLIDVTKGGYTPKNLSQQIKTLSDDLGFMKDKYNMANVKTFTPKENLVVITTSDEKNDMLCNVLADAFNMEKAEIDEKIVLIPEFRMKGKTQTTNAYISENLENGETGIIESVTSLATTTDFDKTKMKPLAILMDKDLLQIYDTWHVSGSFFNEEKGHTNYFENLEGICSTCLFANGILFYKTI